MISCSGRRNPAKRSASKRDLRLRRRSAASTHLLHQHVDVGLGCIQHVSVRVFQAFYCDFHRVSVDVDPPRSPACQERPGNTTEGGVGSANVVVMDLIDNSSLLIYRDLSRD